MTRVLQCQPDNAKALYRKSRILSAMGRNSEALEAARAAAAAAPDDSGTRKELQRCEQRAHRDRSVERRLAKRMLGTTDPSKGAAAPDKKPSRAKVSSFTAQSPGQNKTRHYRTGVHVGLLVTDWWRKHIMKY